MDKRAMTLTAAAASVGVLGIGLAVGLSSRDDDFSRTASTPTPPATKTTPSKSTPKPSGSTRTSATPSSSANTGSASSTSSDTNESSQTTDSVQTTADKTAPANVPTRVTTTQPAPNVAPTTRDGGSGGLRDGRYTGRTSTHRYGSVTVTATISGGKLTQLTENATANDTKSEQYNSRAIPVLKKSALAAGNANIATVSGATYTSQAYLSSLQSALDQAA